MQNLFFFLDKIHQLSHIPVRCLDKSGTITLLSKGYPSRADPVKHEPLKRRLLALPGESDVPVIMCGDDGVAYAAMKDTLDCVVIWGPVAVGKLEQEQIKRYADLYEIAEDDFFIVKRSVTELRAAASLLYAARYDRLPPEQNELPESGESVLPEAEKNAPPPIEAASQLYIMANTEEGIARLAYENERNYLKRIQEGIADKTEIPDNRRIAEYQVGKMAEKPLKHFEYMICSSITLSTRAAMDGGLSPVTAYAMSDLYLQRLEKCKNINEMFALHAEMKKNFTLQVSLSRQKHSKYSHVEKCKNYVNQNLNKAFTIDDIAEAMHINKAHLSRLFKQETGISIMHYARNRRIEAAKNMLRYSEESISNISFYLCFQSQSNFGQVFKEYTGVTPKMYRDKTQ